MVMCVNSPARQNRSADRKRRTIPNLALLALDYSRFDATSCSEGYMRFPFEQDRPYTIGELRAFERELSATRQATARQGDEALTREWRVPSTPEGRRWAKLREETYPIKLLADHKDYRNDDTFRLKPYAFPGLDADLSAGGEYFTLQITLADPIWAKGNAKIQHGGYDHRLLMESLNRRGFVHGSGNFRRDGDQIVCDEPVKKGSDRADACRKGILAALARKSKPGVLPTTRLLVYTRAYGIQVAYEGYASVVAEAIREFEASEHVIPFATVYFVDESEFAVHNRPSPSEV
jgi:hypothetical protein